MVKPSSSRTHGFNETILSLKHYAFRQLLEAPLAAGSVGGVPLSPLWPQVWP
jgi:hypothetical protein